MHTYVCTYTRTYMYAFEAHNVSCMQIRMLLFTCIHTTLTPSLVHVTCMICSVISGVGQLDIERSPPGSPEAILTPPPPPPPPPYLLLDVRDKTDFAKCHIVGGKYMQRWFKESSFIMFLHRQKQQATVKMLGKCNPLASEFCSNPTTMRPSHWTSFTYVHTVMVGVVPWCLH